MQRLEVSGAVRPLYGSLGVERLKVCYILPHTSKSWPVFNRALRSSKQTPPSQRKEERITLSIFLEPSTIAQRRFLPVPQHRNVLRTI